MMRNKVMAATLGGLLALGAQAALYAQDQTQAPTASEQQQGPRHRGMDPDRQLEHMTKVLNLSTDQQAQIKPILVDRQQKMQALWQDQTVAQQDRHAKMEAIQQDSKTRIEAVLNDQQKQQFDSMHHGQRSRGEAPQNGTMQPQ